MPTTKKAPETDWPPRTKTPEVRWAGGGIWFYHAPARSSVKEAEPVPYTSQIPLLNDFPPPPPEDPSARCLVRDTDSKYVRLAKQGGRPDLLCPQGRAGKSEEAVGYPRVNWYYLEDNALEDAEVAKVTPQNKHEFLLPDYMVHEDYRPHGDAEDHPTEPRRRAPYTFDNQTVFEREDSGAGPTDKTVRLPEVKREGYGVRFEKMKDKPVKHMVRMPERGKAPPPEYTPERKFHHMTIEEEERPAMSKILSFGYAKDWDEARDKWQTDNAKSPAKGGATAAQHLDKLETEYQAAMRKNAKNKGSQRPTSHHSNKSSSSNRKAAPASAQDTEKELFKMSRSKNVRQKPKRRSDPPFFNEPIPLYP